MLQVRLGTSLKTALAETQTCIQFWIEGRPHTMNPDLGKAM